MIERVINSINLDGQYIFVIKREHNEKYNLEEVLRSIKKDAVIYYVDKTTDGAACTALLTRYEIGTNESLLIANSDQFIKYNLRNFIINCGANDGSILTFYSNHPKWSYALTNQDGLVTKVAEKSVISESATVGIYYFKRGSDFVEGANSMIEKNIRVNNEFYICPVYNELIEKGLLINTTKINQMYGMGTPEDLQDLLNCNTLRKINLNINLFNETV